MPRLAGVAALVEPTSNDNERLASAGLAPPTGSGEAAILLVESLIHGLVARSVITIDEAIEIVDTASLINAEMAEARGGLSTDFSPSLTILGSISASLRLDHLTEGR
jgi:hypothetical protein